MLSVCSETRILLIGFFRATDIMTQVSCWFRASARATRGVASALELPLPAIASDLVAFFALVNRAIQRSRQREEKDSWSDGVMGMFFQKTTGPSIYTLEFYAELFWMWSTNT